MPKNRPKLFEWYWKWLRIVNFFEFFEIWLRKASSCWNCKWCKNWKTWELLCVKFINHYSINDRWLDFDEKIHIFFNKIHPIKAESSISIVEGTDTDINESQSLNEYFPIDSIFFRMIFLLMIYILRKQRYRWILKMKETLLLIKKSNVWNYIIQFF